MKILRIPCEKTHIDLYLVPDKIVSYHTFDSLLPEDNVEGDRHNHVLRIDTVNKSYLRYFKYATTMGEWENVIIEAIESL